MIRGVKLKLNPTKVQESLMFKAVNHSRFAYNWGLEKWMELESEENGGHRVTSSLLKTLFVDLKKQEGYEWLNEISARTLSKTFEDLELAVKKIRKMVAEDSSLYPRYKGDNGRTYPKFKSKKRVKASFYVRSDNSSNTGYTRLRFSDTHLTIEKVGRVRYKFNKDLELDLSKIYNARCHFDGKYWYLTFSCEFDENQVNLTEGLSVGVDVGIKYLAVVSNLDKPFKNINKTNRVRNLEKKLKRLQRQVSRKYELNKEGSKFVKTKNIIKLEQRIKLLHRRLKNIRLNYTHHVSKAIVEIHPSRIVMENLNIRGMMKNKHRSKAIQKQNLYELRRQVQYKAENKGIKFILADSQYPSTKKCSNCGVVKERMTLSQRVFQCDSCGFVGDRDKNASYNLANYEENWRYIVTV